MRTYCAVCDIRLDLSLAEAQEIFGLAGLTFKRTGVVLLFPDGCARCRDDHSAPEIYVIDEPDDDVSVRC